MTCSRAGSFAAQVEDGQVRPLADGVVVQQVQGIFVQQVLGIVVVGTALGAAAGPAVGFTVADEIAIGLDAMDVEALVVGLGPVHGPGDAPSVEGDVEGQAFDAGDFHYFDLRPIGSLGPVKIIRPQVLSSSPLP